ncbi:MAG: polyphosphate--glucose phosphotransferase [Candidatus Zixiibacteriota bacterium]
MTPLVLGFDIGGSLIKCAVVDITTGQTRTEPIQVPLPQPATPTAVFAELRAALGREKWHGPVGVGYPGVVKNGFTLTGAHLDRSFIGLNWLDDLRKLTAQPVALINDADAAGLAEIRFGAARIFAAPDAGTVLLVTLGTGIGSALFHGGRLLPNTEFGHMLMGEREAEQWAAGSVRIRENLDWPAYGARVGRFLREMEKLVSPDLIVVGGGVSENFALFGPHIDIGCATVPAELGNRAGLIGAALAVTEE